MKKVIYKIAHENSIALVAKKVLELSSINKIQFVYLNGQLGVGKTALTKEIAKLLNIQEPITSPTFNYIKIYPKLVHIDAYHLVGDLDEFEDYFENNLVIIEWANLLNLHYRKFINVNITLDKNNNHIFEIFINYE